MPFTSSADKPAAPLSVLPADMPHADIDEVAAHTVAGQYALGEQDARSAFDFIVETFTEEETVISAIDEYLSGVVDGPAPVPFKTAVMNAMADLLIERFPQL